LPPIMDQARQLLEGFQAHRGDVADELSFRLQQEQFLMLSTQEDKAAAEQYAFAWKAQYIPDSLFVYRIAMHHKIEDIPQSAVELFPSYYRRKYDLICWKKGKAGMNRGKALLQIEAAIQQNIHAMSLREEEEWFLCALEYRQGTRQYKEQLAAIQQFIRRRKRLFWHAPKLYMCQLYEFQSIAYEKMKDYRLAFLALKKADDFQYAAKLKGRFQNDEIFSCLMSRQRMLEEVRNAHRQHEQIRKFHEELEDDSILYNLDTKDVSTSLDVLEQFMQKEKREDTVGWLQLLATQIRGALVGEEKICHPLQYELERFSEFVHWLQPVSGHKLDVEVHFTGNEDDGMIDVPVSMLQLILQQLRVQGKDNQQITLNIETSEQVLHCRWMVQPALVEKKWSDRRLRRLIAIWNNQLDRDVQLHLLSDGVKTDIHISWLLIKESV